MSTRWSIAEQCLSVINGGEEKEAAWADERDVYPYIGQVLNSLLKLDYFKVTLDNGDTTPDGLSVATYDNIPVTTYKNTAKLALPAMPIRLPRNLGVRIGPSTPAAPNNFLTSEFIPIPTGHSILLNGQPMISGLLGQIGYEVEGINVIFSTDITQPPNEIALCWVKLVVMDMSQYSDYDILPIPADMEAQCIQQAIQLFMSQRPPVKVDDPITVKPPAQ